MRDYSVIVTGPPPSTGSMYEACSPYLDPPTIEPGVTIAEYRHAHPRKRTRWQRLGRLFHSRPSVIRDGGYQPTRDPNPTPPESLVRRLNGH